MRPTSDRHPLQPAAPPPPAAAPPQDAWRDLDALKAQVATLLCHEVRGALCVLAGFLDLAADDVAQLDDDARAILEHAREQMDRTTSLLGDLGNFARMQPVATAENALLGDVVESLRTAFAAQFPHAKLQARVEPTAASWPLPAEFACLALRSLADNLTRLDAAPAVLQLDARRIETGLEIEIARAGCDLDANASFLRAFARAAGAREPQGNLELGHWIACRAVAALGGELVLIGEPGVGVRYTLRSPASPGPGG